MRVPPDIPPNYPEYMTTLQLAQLVGVTKTTIRNWVKKGLLPPPIVLSSKSQIFPTTQVRRALAELFPIGQQHGQEHAGEDLAREDLGQPAGQPAS